MGRKIQPTGSSLQLLSLITRIQAKVVLPPKTPSVAQRCDFFNAVLSE